MKTTSDTIALLMRQRNYRGAADYALKEVTDLGERVELLTKILVEVQEHGSMDDAIYIHANLEEQSAELEDATDAFDDEPTEVRVREWDRDAITVDLKPLPRGAS